MNFPTLFKIIPEPFGLDISDESIKIVKLRWHTGGLFLENFGEVSLEKGTMQDGAVILENKAQEALQDLLKRLHVGAGKNSYVACSLPEPKTYVRVVQLPKVKEGEIKEAIQWEVEANVPLPLKDLYFDWEIIPPLHAQAEHLDILVSAAPRVLVDSYISLLKKARLQPFSFEPESVALSRALVRGGIAEKPMLIVDLGQTRTTCMIYAGAGLRFTSSIQISGNGMTENIKRAFGVSYEEAERLKKDVGIDRKDDRVFEAVLPALSALRDQIKEYMNFFAGHVTHIHNGKSGVTGVLLAGGGAGLKGLTTYLSMSLGVPVARGDPWVNILEMPLKETPKLPYDASMRYGTALGLALTPFREGL